MENNKGATKKCLILSIFMLLLVSISCSTILKHQIMTPEIADTGWVAIENEAKIPRGTHKCTHYEFRLETTSIIVYKVGLTDGVYLGYESLSFGPPLLPIFPKRSVISHSSAFGFVVKIETSDGLITVDLYNTCFRLPTETILPSKVYLRDEGGVSYDIKVDYARTYRKGKILEPGNITVSKSEQIFDLQLYGFPPNCEEMVVDLGTLQVNGKDIRLPPLKYYKTTRYKYVPFVKGV